MGGYFFCSDKNSEIELGKDIDTTKRFSDYLIAILAEIGYYKYNNWKYLFYFLFKLNLK